MTAPSTIPRPSLLCEQDFLDRFGAIYEHSPWVAQSAFQNGIDLEDDTALGLSDTFSLIVERAPYDFKLKLLRAHPELAGKLALENKLTSESKSEQSSAGLDQCSPSEYKRFHDLNSLYTEKFGFPFIIAVRGLNRHDILSAFELRYQNGLEKEFTTALSQVHKIARLRLEELDRVAL